MYSRKTELRHIHPTDVYRLSQILENGSWKKLMQIIPKSDVANEYKYNNDHIRLIETESIRQLRFATEILFDEWGITGKKRPTVEQLLDLLVKAELFRAADLVASSFLNEPPPKRPSTGPAAKIDLSLPFDSEIFCDVADMLNNGSEPNTEALLDNALLSDCQENKDFYSKYDRNDKDLNSLVKPLPPPRALKHPRLQQQNDSISNQESTQEIPNLSHLLQSSEILHTKSNLPTTSSLMPSERNTEVTNLSLLPDTRNISSEGAQDMLPMISALNITSPKNEDEGRVEPPISFSRTSCHTSESSNIDEDDEDDIGLPDFDDEDVSAPNRSLIEQRSSNNDSSLTNITSDNSFELSIEGSFDASNDNIPHLSVLLQ